MNAKLCYVLPEYNPASHLYHTRELLELLTKEIDIFLYIERSSNRLDVKNTQGIYFQKFSQFPLSIAERLIIFSYIRLRGYKKFYIHINYFSAMIASIITRLTGGTTYYWNCGMRCKKERKFGLSLKLINYLVTGTETMKEHYAKTFGISRDKIQVIPNSINLARFSASEHKSGEAKTVLFLHWLSKRKGAHHLAEIISYIDSVLPSTRYLIVGDGTYQEKLENEIAQINARNKVSMIGAIPNNNVKHFYLVADLFILPSTDEGFPRVLLEAMATGLPFVASDVGGIRDIVSPLQSKYLTPVGKNRQFSKNVVEILKDDKLREALAVDGLEQVKKYEISRVAKKFIDMINTNIRGTTSLD